MAAQDPTLDHYQEDSLTYAMFITHCTIRLEYYKESHNKVRSLSLAERQVVGINTERKRRINGDKDAQISIAAEKIVTQENTRL